MKNAFYYIKKRNNTFTTYFKSKLNQLCKRIKKATRVVNRDIECSSKKMY